MIYLAVKRWRNLPPVNPLNDLHCCQEMAQRTLPPPSFNPPIPKTPIAKSPMSGCRMGEFDMQMSQYANQAAVDWIDNKHGPMRRF